MNARLQNESRTYEMLRLAIVCLLCLATATVVVAQQDDADSFGFEASGETVTADPDPFAASAKATTQPVVWTHGNRPAIQKIKEILAQPLTSVGLDFEEAPLEEIVDFLRDEYQLEIHLDLPALDELGIAEDEQVTCNLRNISLRSGLRLMLRPLELTTIIVDEVLLVTTEEEADTHLVVGIYPVGDMLNEHAGLDDILDVLVTTVAADTWAENGGGEAEIRPLGPGRLVVSQTQAVHEQILDTLNALRQASRLPEAKAPPNASRRDQQRGSGRRPSPRRGGMRGGRGGFAEEQDHGGGGQFRVPVESP
ncbi:MAG: hypothetical protein AAGF31_05925 [Planctomycetota bacterium]